MPVPKLWNETIASHRHTVHEAILTATAELVSEHGLLSVTMSQIAERSGIGRATLYKYFPDIEAILRAWHERQIACHLHQLGELRERGGPPGERLQVMLEAYARISSGRFSHDHAVLELAAVLHTGAHVVEAEQQVHDLFKELLTEVAEVGGLRDDVAPDELATYCLHALSAARSLHSESAVRRLVMVTIAGLRPAR
ncbi:MULTISPECIES: TetR/AcrR family transcriptional regulator [Prauserella]|uniref:TetR/AcrR family transcriptional regulator n=1 Tax=Prauserella TaxID=142577 RepID=UPI001E2D16CB|nr:MULTISPECIES: TetR/AcrR family transcriptional regulator [Prauserella]